LPQLVAHMQKIPRAYLRIIRARIAESKREAAQAARKTEETKSE
jgi:hypothetical protein